MKPTNECFIRLSDLKKPMEENPFDPNRGDVSAYLRYLKYNTPYVNDVKCAALLISSDGYPYCSACTFQPHELTRYCPECGARMDGDVRE